MFESSLGIVDSLESNPFVCNGQPKVGQIWWSREVDTYVYIRKVSAYNQEVTCVVFGTGTAYVVSMESFLKHFSFSH